MNNANNEPEIKSLSNENPQSLSNVQNDKMVEHVSEYYMRKILNLMNNSPRKVFDKAYRTQTEINKERKGAESKTIKEATDEEGNTLKMLENGKILFNGLEWEEAIVFLIESRKLLDVIYNLYHKLFPNSSKYNGIKTEENPLGLVYSNFFWS